MAIWWAAGALIVIGLTIFGWMSWNAPEGYEDAEGFHLGEPPKRERGEDAQDRGDA